jgi:radical SAM protein with 4Fe4S-binding SPASM domain
MSEYVPEQLHLQWHVTQKCNLRCTHCYQESYEDNDMPFDSLIDIVEQYKDTLDHYSRKSGRKVQGHITVTGGEPFARKDFFELLNYFSINRYHFTFSILTNGTLIDEQMAKKIKQYNPTYVQVSIEGSKKTHEGIRGKGSYDKTVKALEHLVEENIPTLISFTAHKKNYHEFSEVAKLGGELGVTRVWSDRLIPYGSGKEEMMLTKEETKEYFSIMKQSKKEQEGKTEVAMHRALQFLEGGREYKCSAGKTLITIDSDGKVYPCRRMPITFGNIKEEKLIDIYNKMDKLRENNSECDTCPKYTKCGGGLRCLSYAVTNDYTKKDPGCWIEN